MYRKIIPFLILSFFIGCGNNDFKSYKYTKPFEDNNTVTITDVNGSSVLSDNNLLGEEYEVFNSTTLFPIRTKCDEVLEKIKYTGCYSYRNKLSLWIAYTLTSSEAKSKAKRLTLFKPDMTIDRSYRVIDAYYKGSGYDRGHLMPNAIADFNIDVQKESFLFSNIAPQLAKLNRKGWKKIEGVVQNYFNNEDTLYIITGLIPSKNRYIQGRVNIPDYFYKIIYNPRTHKTLNYLVPHREIDSKKIGNYIVSIKEIEDKLFEYNYPVNFMIEN